MKMDWITAAYELNRQGNAYVVATIIGISGSTPRNNGTKMVISQNEIFDTIGGGHLEHKVIKFANKLLIEGKTCQQLEHFQLGIHLDQCCGGSANVLFECFSANQVNIMLFGAGNVAQALIPILSSLPCQIKWVDNRKAQFGDACEQYKNVTKMVSQSPEDEVANMPKNSYYIVMTHKHQMDFDISKKIFERNDFKYFGLIGSKTKRRRFEQRFVQHGIDQQQLKRMICPIGMPQVSGKLPTEIAVSIAGEIISLYQQQAQQQNQQENNRNDEKGIHWRNLKLLSVKKNLIQRGY